MFNDLKDIIKQEFHEGISLNCEDWSSILTNTNNVQVTHLRSTVKYYVEYYSGQDLSLVLYDNYHAVGILPLFIHKNKKEWIISGDGESIVKPLFINNLPKKTKKNLEKKIIEIIDRFAIKLSINKVYLFDESSQLSSWYMLWLKKSSKCFLSHQLAINLEISIDDIRLGFRKSYKSLVNKSLKDFSVQICEHNIDNLFEEFRMLHLEVAGKETRSRESWNIQKEQIKNNEAFLVTVMDGNALIGAGLFTYTKDIGVYSVGAYKRELFDKPISHGVQMQAIRALKDIGCRVYYIGQKMTLLDKNLPTEKELSITHFKEGFAGYVFAQPHLEVNYSE